MNKSSEGEKENLDWSLWQVILCINLTGWKDTEIAGKTFLGVFAMVFLEAINLWLSKLIKEDNP
jgi:hypothetical protein